MTWKEQADTVPKQQLCPEHLQKEETKHKKPTGPLVFLSFFQVHPFRHTTYDKPMNFYLVQNHQNVF